MGKKRRTNNQLFGQQELSDRRFEGDSKLKLNTWEDVADSEDEFYINRDKIHLEEGPVQKKQRKLDEERERLSLL